MIPKSPHAPRAAIVGAVLGTLALAVGFVLARDATVRAWLAADLMILGLSLGALLILAIHRLTDGSWGHALRPVLGPMAAALPVPLAGMIVPLLGMPDVLAWTNADPATLPDAVRHKLLYFGPTLLAARLIVIAVLWAAVAFAFGLFGSRRFGERRSVAIVTLVIFAISMTVFSTDWMMGLDPRFHSTIYPMLESSGEIVGAFAFGIAALCLWGPLRHSVESAPGVLLSEDLANLFLGFVLLWVYLAFMQWLIVWSGDLPDETGWYIARTTGAWRFVFLLVVVLHGAIPVASLLNRRVKRTPWLLLAVAGATAAGHILDVVWRILPAFPEQLPVTAALTFAALAALGGVWGLAAMWMADRQWARAREARNA